jgi:hypothetical protein
MDLAHALRVPQWVVYLLLALAMVYLTRQTGRSSK